MDQTAGIPASKETWNSGVSRVFVYSLLMDIESAAGTSCPRPATQRQLRLFMVGACRLADYFRQQQEASQEKLHGRDHTSRWRHEARDLAERYADGQIGPEPLRRQAEKLSMTRELRLMATGDQSLVASLESLVVSCRHDCVACTPALCDLLRDIFGNPRDPVLPGVPCAACAGTGLALPESRWVAGMPQRRCLQCHSGWTPGSQPWLTPLIRDLAEAAYEERDADFNLDGNQLNVLADALTESVTDPALGEQLAAHLRAPCSVCQGKEIPCDNCQGSRRRRHVRGCWVVDALRGHVPATW